MLILTRRVGETVVIGNDVDVTVLGVKGNQVRLGVKAPREVSVHREEIYKRIKSESAEQQPSQPVKLKATQSKGSPAGTRSSNAQHGHNGHQPAVND